MNPGVRFIIFLLLFASALLWATPAAATFGGICGRFGGCEPSPPDPCRRGGCDFVEPGPTPEQVQEQARQQEEERRKEEERIQLEKLRQQHEKEERERQERLAKSYDLHSRAIELHNSGNLPDAIESYRQARDLNPGNQNIIDNLALAETTLRRREEHTAAFTRVQNIIDGLADTTKTDLTPSAPANPCGDTNFFGSCGNQVMVFGDPDRLDPASRRARGGFDSRGKLWGARTEVPADVEGGPLDPDRRSKDPEMIAVVKELDVILEQQVRLDDSLRQLQTERNRQQDAAKMAELNVRIDQVNAEKQQVLVKKVEIIEKKKKLHRTIDTSEKPKEGIAK